MQPNNFIHVDTEPYAEHTSNVAIEQRSLQKVFHYYQERGRVIYGIIPTVTRNQNNSAFISKALHIIWGEISDNLFPLITSIQPDDPIHVDTEIYAEYVSNAATEKMRLQKIMEAYQQKGRIIHGFIPSESFNMTGTSLTSKVMHIIWTQSTVPEEK